MRIFIATAIGSVALFAPEGSAKDVCYLGSIEAIKGTATVEAARGKVFLDESRNSKLDDGEAGILVSNGRKVVTTDQDGNYELPAYDDINLFIKKPAGHTTSVMMRWCRISTTPITSRARPTFASAVSSRWALCPRRSV